MASNAVVRPRQPDVFQRFLWGDVLTASNAVVHPRLPDLFLGLLCGIGLIISALVNLFVDKEAAEEERKQRMLSLKQVRGNIFVFVFLQIF